MGYREYFYELDKNLVEEIRKCKTMKEFMAAMDKRGLVEEEFIEEDYFPLYKLGKSIFEFGKDYENADNLRKHGESLFSSAELNAEFNSYNAIVVNKEGILCSIEWLKNEIISIYEDLLRETSNDPWNKLSQLDRIKVHVSDHLNWWKPPFGTHTAYNLDEEDDELVRSYLYEHQIFDLVRIYKTFDWENKCIVFLGW